MDLYFWPSQLSNTGLSITFPTQTAAAKISELNCFLLPLLYLKICNQSVIASVTYLFMLPILLYVAVLGFVRISSPNYLLTGCSVGVAFLKLLSLACY